MSTAIARELLVRRGRWLTAATLGYNTIEAVVAIAAGIAAASISLTGFGVDSLIELASSIVALRRLGADGDAARRERIERQSHRAIGALFLLLAAYIAWEAVESLVRREGPRESPVGIALAAASLVVMPLLARAKRRVASGLSSRALDAEATQTSLCAWLSAILLAGLVLEAVVGWWWADPVAALVMVPIIAREGIEGVRGEPSCDCH